MIKENRMFILGFILGGLTGIIIEAILVVGRSKDNNE
jgi:hypothetical protein